MNQYQQLDNELADMIARKADTSEYTAKIDEARNAYNALAGTRKHEARYRLRNAFDFWRICREAQTGRLSVDTAIDLHKRMKISRQDMTNVQAINYAYHM